MGALKEAKEKVASQRATVKEHIEKYEKYKKIDPDALNMALRTIKNAQGEIDNLKRRNPEIDSSWEDTWKPN